MIAIILPAVPLFFSLFINMVYNSPRERHTSSIPTHVCSNVFLEQDPFFCVRKLVPFQISAQMIAVLPFKKLTVDTEQGSQKLTADGKCINITLLKKPQILASYGCLEQPVSSYGLHSGSHPLRPICDDGCLDIPSFRGLESLVQLSDHKNPYSQLYSQSTLGELHSSLQDKLLFPYCFPLHLI